MTLVANESVSHITLSCVLSLVATKWPLELAFWSFVKVKKSVIDFCGLLHSCPECWKPCKWGALKPWPCAANFVSGLLTRVGCHGDFGGCPTSLGAAHLQKEKPWTPQPANQYNITQFFDQASFGEGGEHLQANLLVLHRRCFVPVLTDGLCGCLIRCDVCACAAVAL